MKNTVYHVQFKNPKDGLHEHYYFGSLTAIYDILAYSDVGVKKESLWSNHNFNNGPYENSQVVIRKGHLIRTKTNRGVSSTKA